MRWLTIDALLKIVRNLVEFLSNTVWSVRQKNDWLGANLRVPAIFILSWKLQFVYVYSNL